MNFFASTCTKRNTAIAVLLVWLFALGSSVANACFLQTEEPHSRAAQKSAATTMHAPAAGHAQTGTDAGHHNGLDGSKESCLKVCDDGTHTLPKAQSGADHNDPGPAPLVTTLWTASQHIVSVPRRANDLALPTVGPPLRVRYSRLTL